MKNPEFRHKLLRLLCASSIVMAVTVAAESPEIGTARSRPSRARPQVIYHLPAASNYSATLHSQAKNQNHELPIDNPVPAPVQPVHANANAPAAEQPVAIRRQKPNLKARGRSNRPPARPHSFGKSAGHGNGHANHSHKK
jgi:hypothetical protein